MPNGEMSGFMRCWVKSWWTGRVVVAVSAWLRSPGIGFGAGFFYVMVIDPGAGPGFILGKFVGGTVYPQETRGLTGGSGQVGAAGDEQGNEAEHRERRVLPWDGAGLGTGTARGQGLGGLP